MSEKLSLFGNGTKDTSSQFTHKIFSNEGQTRNKFRGLFGDQTYIKDC